MLQSIHGSLPYPTTHVTSSIDCIIQNKYIIIISKKKYVLQNKPEKSERAATRESQTIRKQSSGTLRKTISFQIHVPTEEEEENLSTSQVSTMRTAAYIAHRRPSTSFEKDTRYPQTLRMISGKILSLYRYATKCGHPFSETQTSCTQYLQHSRREEPKSGQLAPRRENRHSN
jgi:hypothetical protein